LPHLHHQRCLAEDRQHQDHTQQHGSHGKIDPYRRENTGHIFGKLRVVVEVRDEKIDVERHTDQDDRHAGDHVDHLVHQKGLQCFGEGYPVILAHHGAAPDIAGAGQHKIDGIVAQGGIDQAGSRGVIAEGVDKQLPPESPEGVTQQAEEQGEGNDAEVGRLDDMPQLSHIGIPIHGPQNKKSQ